MATNYTAKDITVLEGLDPVRKRPGMYIGGVGSAGLHHLVWEIVDNAVDEAMNGYAKNIWVTLHADGTSITVEDDGRGAPVDKHPTTKKSALETIFTVLHAGGKFEQGNYVADKAFMTVFMNHEIPNTSGVARAHGSTGAFVSQWTIHLNTLQVKWGQDLIQDV